LIPRLDILTPKAEN